MTISSDVLARYAADAASQVGGLHGLVESTFHRHRGVRVLDDDSGRVRVELHVAIEFGASIPVLGRELQRRVASYLAQMASVEVNAVDVVVERVVTR